MVWGPLQIFVRAVRVVVCTALLVACASVQNNPINQPLSDDGTPVAAHLGPGVRGMADVSADADETVVALSFSGGGPLVRRAHRLRRDAGAEHSQPIAP